MSARGIPIITAGRPVHSSPRRRIDRVAQAADNGVMSARVAADLVMVVHFVFVAFVLVGGLLVVWRPRLAWLHLPCALWGAAIEFGGFVCPLTPLEIRLRHAAGQEGFAGGFVAHYLEPLVYPPGLTRELQVTIGIGVLALNGILYAWARRRHRRRR